MIIRDSRAVGDFARSLRYTDNLIRCVRPFKVIYKRRSTTVDLPGYQPKGDGDGVHVGNDMSVIDRALRMLKQKVDGIPAQETIRKVRTNSVCPNDELVPCSRSDRPHLTSLSEA
jgi:hypothetical protein